MPNLTSPRSIAFLAGIVVGIAAYVCYQKKQTG